MNAPNDEKERQRAPVDKKQRHPGQHPDRDRREDHRPPTPGKPADAGRDA